MESDNPIADAELIRAYLQTQSETAFSQLVQRYVNLVYSTAFRRTNDSHLAEDITQAVFLLLATKCHRLPEQAPLCGWLFRTARYMSADAIKIRRRRQFHERAAAMLRASDDQVPRISDETMVHLERAIDRLSGEDRDAILLRYFQGMSVTEVARNLRISANAAAKRLSRAIQRLRFHFESLGATARSDLDGTLASQAIRSAPSALTALCLPSAAMQKPGAVLLARNAARIRWITPVGIAACALLAIVGFAAARRVLAPPAVVPPAANPPIALIASAATTAPAEAQQRQVLAAIYTLQHFNAFIMARHWTAAIHTLVQIGSTAVPEITAELDRTSRDNELRALAFTLRAIGDPRACPALIRASRRVTTRGSSTLGLNVADPELSAFMRAHQVTKNSMPGFMLNTADVEINSALQSLTRHNAGWTFRWRAGVITDQELAEARQWQNSLADHWQTWWDQHHDSLVSDQQLSTLTAEPHTAEAVEAAGLAVDGPPFPTGRPYHLGPVQDTWGTSYQEEADLVTLVSFDRCQTMSQLDAIRRLPSDSKVDLGRDPWCFAPPLYMNAVCEERMFAKPRATQPTPHGAMSPYSPNVKPEDWIHSYILYPVDCAIWPTAQSTWDTLNDTITAGKEVQLDPAGPYSDFDEPHRNEDSKKAPSSTYLIRTDSGGAGIVQVLERDTAHHRLHFRFRMVEPRLTPLPALPQPAMQPGCAFGNEQQVTLATLKPGDACAFSFRNGKIIDAPQDPAEFAKKREWMMAREADATLILYTTGKPAGLVFCDTVMVEVSAGQFDCMAPGMAWSVLDRLKTDPERLEPLVAPGSPSVNGDLGTVIFRTRDGTSGILQITQIISDPPSLQFRYKLLNDGE